MPTTSEFAGSTSLLSIDDFYSGADAIDKAAQSQANAPLSYAKDLGRKMVMLPAAAVDLVAGMPADIAAKAANTGTRIFGASQGKESAKTVGQAGAEAENLNAYIPDFLHKYFDANMLKTPVQSALRGLGLEEHDQSGVSATFDRIGKAVEKHTNGLVTSEDTQYLLGTAMDAGGLAAVKPALRAIAQSKVPVRDYFAPSTEGVAGPRRLEAPPLASAEEFFAGKAPQAAKLEQPVIEGEFSRVEEGTPQLTQKGAADPKLLAAIAGAGGLAAYIGSDSERAQNLLAGGLVAGAIKPAGGMWHPEAVERLASAIEPDYARIKAANGGTDAGVPGATQERYNTAQRLVKGYLNRYAGTERDPLKDVEIPFGEGVKRWEDVTDAAFKASPAKNVLPLEQLEGLGGKIKAEEPIYHLADDTARFRDDGELRPINARAAITSYLSHVGDYLREHVPADKLPQYDLVRAVKETVKWDKELAKNMEKERLDDTKGSPVYKDYGDGMRWVQLTKPGQFARESDAMGHSVRGYEPPIGRGQDLTQPPERLPNGNIRLAQSPNHPDWIPASGDSGHPSYGLGGWEAIKRGDAKVYSLRDAKGGSHVTVEVAGEVRPEDAGGLEEPARITQIKGKQNRAPAAEYLPYVQDFVKSGKWGEVGDVENAGLVPKASLYPTVKAKVIAALGDKPYYTKEEIDTAFPPPQGQRGSINPKLLATLGGAALGAAAGASLGDTKGAIYGALAGALLGSGAGRHPLAALDHMLGVVSTRIGHISPPLLRRARDFEMRVMKRTQAAYDASHPFLAAYGKLPKDQQAGAKLALLNGQFQHIVAHPELRPVFKPVVDLLVGLEKELRGLGRFREGVTNYFPRVVSDFEGLKKALGQDITKGLDRVLADAEAKSIREKGRGLSDVEQSIIINRFIFAPAQASHLPSFARGRQIGEITPDLAKFYADPRQSFLRYISGAVSDIETAKFFGKDLINKKRGEKEFTDIDASIGELIRKQMQGKEMDTKQVAELQKLLHSRFVNAEKSMSGPLQDIRNMSNLGLLGNVLSAATQTGDSILTVAYHGLVPVYKALLMKATGEKISPAQLGLVNHVVEELASQRWTGRMLGAGLKYSGFAAIDRFAKGVNVNAALIKNQRLARSKPARFAEKWQASYGPDFPQLVQDVKDGRVSDLTESLAFAELSNVQPITKLEMPQAYHDHPNGRLLYQLKSYMIKQADVVRREAYDEIKDGIAAKNYKQVMRGVKALGVLALGFAVANIPGDSIKNWLNGRPLDLSLPAMVENLAQTFGLGRYSQEKIAKGNPEDVVKDQLTPPAVKMGKDILNGDPRALSYIPFVGRILYNRFGGGNERSELADAKRKDAQRKKELGVDRLPPEERTPLSPKTDQFRRERQNRSAGKIADLGEGFKKSMTAIEARELFRDQERKELLAKARRLLGPRGEREFLQMEEQAEIRRAMPQGRRSYAT